MQIPLSIIIPTFNEEKYLPKLLHTIQLQSVKPAEIIVVDAFSIDNTAKIAKKFGCKVVRSSAWISGARNIGAKIAKAPLLLFLESDVTLPPRFLEKTVHEMHKRELDIASCFLTPMSLLKRDLILHEVTNYYLQITKDFHPHSPGFCIFVKRALHNKLQGFDESIALAEDHNYVWRAKKAGKKFGFLKSARISVSVRRLAEEGRAKLILKYIAVELHLLFLGKITKNFFSYKFGEHS